MTGAKTYDPPDLVDHIQGKPMCADDELLVVGLRCSTTLT
jgi:non-ribosomal peptide synthetase component E (peptide arylation enzyme)